MNAYDDPGGDGIVLDVVRHPSMFRTHVLGPAVGVDVPAVQGRHALGGPEHVRAEH